MLIQQLNSLVSEKIRILLYLSKQQYPSNVQQEIELMKKNFKEMKTNASTMTVETIKQSLQTAQSQLNTVIEVYEIPQEQIESKKISMIL